MALRDKTSNLKVHCPPSFSLQRKILHVEKCCVNHSIKQVNLATVCVHVRVYMYSTCNLYLAITINYFFELII